MEIKLHLEYIKLFKIKYGIYVKKGVCFFNVARNRVATL